MPTTDEIMRGIMETVSEMISDAQAVGKLPRDITQAQADEYTKQIVNTIHAQTATSRTRFYKLVWTHRGITYLTIQNFENAILTEIERYGPLSEIIEMTASEYAAAQEDINHD